jgi:NhaA family Na+:H+ antiporter
VNDGNRPLPVRRILPSVRQFLGTEASGGILLLAAALIALAWANSPWGDSYRSMWHTPLDIGVGRHTLDGDLRHWVNDGLMVVFFFVVGLEIKQELVRGELRDPRTAAMPALAALGGMVVPALVYLLVAAGSGRSRGWGVPMATDIAFAVGVVTLLGPRVPASLKLFLLTLAVVDDIGAIVVIGLFYSSGVEPQFLAAAVALVGAIVVLKRAGVVRLAPYLVLGAALWLVTHASGVHATIAGVVLGLLTPATNPTARSAATDLADDPTVPHPDEMGQSPRPTPPPAERLIHALHPWSSFVIFPVFALANAGVVVRAGSFDAPGTTAVTVGVVLGLVVGKALGITGAAWLAARSGLGRLPEGATWPMMWGIAAVGGIGFTVSLFIAELAFEAGPLQEAAKLGVLAGSTVAAVVGGAALRRACRWRGALAP